MPDTNYASGPVPDDTADEYARAMEPVARELLRGRPVKRRGGKEWRYGTHGSLCVDIAKGVWTDFETGEDGGTLDLVMRELRTDKPGAKDWLRANGHLPDRSPRQAAGPRQTSRPAASARTTATYIYRDHDGTPLYRITRKATSTGKRFLQARADGKGGWISEEDCMEGVPRVPYRLPELRQAVAERRTVYFAEGEKCVECLVEAGLPATCAAQGTGGWKQEWRKAYSEHFKGADVVILPDNDDGGRKYAREVRETLAPVARSVRIVELPDLPPKGDIYDWLADGRTAAELEALVEKQPAEGAEPLLPLVWFDAIKPVVDAKDFVQRVLGEGAAGVVYGESNAGKTFWTTDLALHVAAGMEWNGRRVVQGGVVFAVLEGGNGFRNRVSAWRRDHGMEDASIPFAAVPASLNLLDPEADTPKLIQTIKAAEAKMGMPVKLLVIDTLSRAMAGGNENAPDDMGALVKNMDAIREATGVFLLFIHHCGKDAAKGARGHSSLRAAIDTEIEVTADETSGRHAATVVKQREMTKGDVFGFRLRCVELGKNEHGEDVTTCVVEPASGGQASGKQRPLSPRDRTALGFLHDLLVAEGQPLPAAWGMAPELLAVPMDRFKAECGQRGLSVADSEKNRRTSISQAIEALIRHRAAATRDGLVWAVHQQVGAA